MRSDAGEELPRGGPGRRLSRTLDRHRWAQLGGLLSGPLLWLLVIYIGSLVSLLLTSLYTTDAFTGNLVKTTSISYAIAVPEMLYVSAQIWSDSVNVKEMMNILLVCYVGLVGLFVYVMHRWERLMRVPGYGG